MEKIELSNFEKPVECCTLEVGINSQSYYRGDKKVSGFTGFYYKDDKSFFAIYPTKSGPAIYYSGKEYNITPNLFITLKKDGKNRTFEIKDYDIKIKYLESPYIGFDVWSDEIDVDLFYMITEKYKDRDFYKKYTSE